MIRGGPVRPGPAISARRTRSSVHRSLVALVMALAIAGSLPLAVTAAHLWSISASQSSVTQHVSTGVTLTIQNTSGNNGGGDSIGCVKVSIPAAYDVDSVTIDSVSRGLLWYKSSFGTLTTVVTLWADDDGERLQGRSRTGRPDGHDHRDRQHRRDIRTGPPSSTRSPTARTSNCRR